MALSVSTQEDPMAELSALMSSDGLSVTQTPNDIAKPHPRFSQYKHNARSSSESQETRRRAILEAQKKRRDDYVNFARALASGHFSEEEEEEEEDDVDDEEKMEADEGGRQSFKYRARKLRRSFKDQLMLSEWWLMVPVPEGRRALVVAGDGETRQYAKSGFLVRTFPSLLPGGMRGHAKQHGTTILDCIFDEVTGTFHVLDLMMWDTFAYYDCDTEFRFYWLSCKLSESVELQAKSKSNPFKFRALEHFVCSESSLQTALLASPAFAPSATDGLLFYHKRVHYLPGSTPLVGWLKGYMVAEMFGMHASDAVMGKVPADYNSMKKFIADFDQKELEKQNKNKQRNMPKVNQLTDMDASKEQPE